MGSPKDYPIDDNGGDSQKNSYFYCPCEEMVVKRIFGVGTTSGNTLWLESTLEVVTPSFTDFVTIKITHSNDDQFANIYVGKKYKKGEKIVLEGDDGKATGYHLHISVGRGKMVGNGWQKNSSGAWVIRTTKGGVKPEEAFYIDPTFTTVRNTKNIKFKYLEPSSNIKYVTASLNVRQNASINAPALNSLPPGTRITVRKTSGNWSEIAPNQWVASNYLTDVLPNKVYYTKYTTAASLNVRKTPNGSILSTKAPLPPNTLVAVMETVDGWIKINTDRWVAGNYLK